MSNGGDAGVDAPSSAVGAGGTASTATAHYCDSRNGEVDAEAPNPDLGIYRCDPGAVCCQSGGIPGWSCRAPSGC
jgi:hypothetical protein